MLAKRYHFGVSPAAALAHLDGAASISLSDSSVSEKRPTAAWRQLANAENFNPNGGKSMRKLSLFVVAFLLLMTASALSQDVRYNFDKNTDFSKFKTYKWVTLKDASPVDSITDKQIKDAIDTELAKKGLTKVDGDNADLYIGYQTAVGQEKEFTAYNSSWGYGGGWYRGGWYGGYPGTAITTTQTSTIYNGQLALDMYDSANHDLVWRGVASKTLDPKAKPEKRQKNLAKAAKKLLKDYPPEVKSS